jgi:hypothetical protein
MFIFRTVRLVSTIAVFIARQIVISNLAAFLDLVWGSPGPVLGICEPRLTHP